MQEIDYINSVVLYRDGFNEMHCDNVTNYTCIMYNYERRNQKLKTIVKLRDNRVCGKVIYSITLLNYN